MTTLFPSDIAIVARSGRLKHSLFLHPLGYLNGLDWLQGSDGESAPSISNRQGRPSPKPTHCLPPEALAGCQPRLLQPQPIPATITSA
jgi:hypothetical protein